VHGGAFTRKVWLTFGESVGDVVGGAGRDQIVGCDTADQEL